MINATRRWFESLPVRGKLIAALSVQLAVLTAVCLSFLLAQREVSRVREWTNHTHLVIELAESLRAEAIAQQTGIRGFLLTGRHAYLDPYRSGTVEFDALVARLFELLRDSPQQQARLRQIESLMRDWQARVAQPRMEGRHEVPTAVDAAGIDLDKRLIDAIKQACADMIDRERGLLGEREAELVRGERLAQGLSVLLLLVGWLTGARTVRSLHRGIGKPLSELAGLVPRLASADAPEVPFRSRRDEVGVMSGALAQLRTSSAELRHREWVAEQATRIVSALQAGDDEAGLAEILLGRLCTVLDGGYGLAWRWDEEQAELQWCGAYGLPDPAVAQRRFRRGEGLVGQVAADGRVIELCPVPAGYLQVVSGLGNALPQRLLLLPVSAHGQIIAVLELGLLRALTLRQRALLDEVLHSAGLAWLSLSRSVRTRELLAESQARAQELHVSQDALRQQQDKLQSVNEALRSRSVQLEDQGRRLAASEREQREQAQELRQANQALEERTRTLRQRQNELEQARAELERKAADLERASRYKSEFLANMSHELRTPLNSMLILSRLLADNAQGNLDEEQVESARIVHDSGQSLLALINDILDLSKVEAGKMRLTLEDVDVRDCLDVLAARFRPLAAQRGLQFVVEVDGDVPARIYSDGARLSQVLSNLLSNALKFTHQGEVRLNARLQDGRLRLSVRDSGIGIPQAQLARVFEAFEQAESGTSRRYGGTGLGLSIVSGMTTLLGGEMAVQSAVGEGSEFIILLPLRLAEPAAAQAPVSVAPPVSGPAAERVVAEGGARPLLVVEDDPEMAERLADVARRRGLEVCIARTGAEALEQARRHRLLGVLLDIGLPDISGWEVLERIKADAHTREVPVHIVSGREESERGLALGAAGFLHKPVSREALQEVLDRIAADGHGVIRRVLIVDDEAPRRTALAARLQREGYLPTEAASGEDAETCLRTQVFDAMACAARLDASPASIWLTQAGAQAALPPVAIYAGTAPDPAARGALAVHTDHVVVVAPTEAPPGWAFDAIVEALTSMLPLRAVRPAPAVAPPAAPVASRPPESRPAALAAGASDLAGRTVLIVDDDMRNVFALSKALRGHGLNVAMAQDGGKALNLLAGRQDIDLVLMDIMMPGMDGYEVIRRIREQPRWQGLPIIAVTAKAMKGDREKCLDAGANDYCPKPIDLDRLLAQLRQWL